MFNSLQPPLLVQPISMWQTTLFPSHEGYCVHFSDKEQALVSYKDGWTFPLSGQQQRFISERPLLLVRDAGGITTASSTFSKGYAHQFCQDDGTEPVYQDIQAIFPDRPDDKWMLIPNAVTMVWLQYGNKNQYCGDSGYDMERIYYGKLLIRKLRIEEDYQPVLGKGAADPNFGAKQYRVDSCQFHNESWSLTDQDANEYLKEVLVSQKLERYQTAVAVALKRAGY